MRNTLVARVPFRTGTDAGGALNRIAELEALEARYPDLITADSPTQRVAGAPRRGAVAR